MLPFCDISILPKLLEQHWTKIGTKKAFRHLCQDMILKVKTQAEPLAVPTGQATPAVKTASRERAGASGAVLRTLRAGAPARS